MTQPDQELVDSVVEQFYRDFQEMVTLAMKKVRPDLRKDLGPRLHEKSSVYGVEWP